MRIPPRLETRIIDAASFIIHPHVREEGSRARSRPPLTGPEGHFLLESGHHGELWLDLELLCLRPESVRKLAVQLAARLAAYRIELVCGPLTEGAFMAFMVASEMGALFAYAERIVPVDAVRATGLYPVQYRLPRELRGAVCNQRVAIVNDVVNAGSAIRGTFADLKACGAKPVAIAALATLGTSAAKFAAEHQVPLKPLASLPNQIWAPAECPLCASGVPLEDRQLP
jgi:orotate phosphoribosyltransferase